MNYQTRIRSARARRQEVQANADALGINDEYIAHLVDTFYGRVRTHTVLGPVFENQIGENWDHHLKMMKDFWASVTMNAGRYSGKPVPAHQKITAISPAHFPIWLALFQTVLEETAPTPGAVAYFMERANRIARSLQLAIIGAPGLEISR